MAITALSPEDESIESESQACHTLPDDPSDDHLLLPHFTPQRLVGGHSFKGLSAWSWGPRQARSALEDVLFLGPPVSHGLPGNGNQKWGGKTGGWQRRPVPCRKVWAAVTKCPRMSGFCNRRSTCTVSWRLVAEIRVSAGLVLSGGGQGESVPGLSPSCW